MVGKLLILSFHASQKESLVAEDLEFKAAAQVAL